MALRKIRLDLQELCDLIVDVHFSQVPLKRIASAYGLSKSYLSDLLIRCHVDRPHINGARRRRPLGTRRIRIGRNNPENRVCS